MARVENLFDVLGWRFVGNIKFDIRRLWEWTGFCFLYIIC
jgi:hypothetical protein